MADDYLKECLSDVGNVPLDEFQRTFCRVCANRGCTRSALNNSVFDQRAKNWKHQLFEAPPRADDADHKYDEIRSKIFAPGGMSHDIRTDSGIATIDKASLTEPRAPSKHFVTLNPQTPPAPPVVEEKAVVAPPEPEEIPPTPIPQLEVPKPTANPQAPLQALPPPQQPFNTQFQQGTILPGGSPQGQEGNTFVFEDDD